MSPRRDTYTRCQRTINRLREDAALTFDFRLLTSEFARSHRRHGLATTDTSESARRSPTADRGRTSTDAHWSRPARKRRSHTSQCRVGARERLASPRAKRLERSPIRNHFTRIHRRLEDFGSIPRHSDLDVMLARRQDERRSRRREAVDRPDEDAFNGYLRVTRKDIEAHAAARRGGVRIDSAVDRRVHRGCRRDSSARRIRVRVGRCSRHRCHRGRIGGRGSRIVNERICVRIWVRHGIPDQQARPDVESRREDVIRTPAACVARSRLTVSCLRIRRLMRAADDVGEDGPRHLGTWIH